MPLPLYVLFALLLGTPGLAQLSSPSGYLTREGEGWESLPTNNSYSSRFGGLRDGHFQQVDGEIRKAGKQSVKAIGFRIDRQASAFWTARRSWKNVSLALSDGDLATMTRSFSANILSTPTVVFSGSVTWPSFAAPSSPPAAWSRALRFGWKTPYLYTARKDLCLDWQFAGGALASGRTWGTRQSVPYFLDALHHRYELTWSPRAFYQTTQGCQDPAITTPRTFAYAAASVGMHGAATQRLPQFAGQAVLQMYGANTAPNSIVIQAVGFRGSSPGTSIGAGCNHLMVDTSAAFFFVHATDGVGAYGPARLAMGRLSAWAPHGMRLEFWSQAAWTTSKTGRFSLTAATLCNPDFSVPFNKTRLRRETLYAFACSTALGLGPYADRAFNPIARFN
jgi:hypothetical protein